HSVARGNPVIPLDETAYFEQGESTVMPGCPAHLGQRAQGPQQQQEDKRIADQRESRDDEDRLRELRRQRNEEQLGDRIEPDARQPEEAALLPGSLELLIENVCHLVG